MRTDNSCSEGATLISDFSSIKMQVKPNPISSLINVVFDNYEETPALDYEVADENGKVLLHGHWPVNKGQNKTIINLSLLTSGAYQLSIRDISSNDILLRQGIVKL